MKTTTTETMKYGPAGELIERVTVVETDEPTGPVNVVQHIHNPDAQNVADFARKFPGSATY